MVGSRCDASGKISSLEASLGLIAATAQLIVGTDIGLRTSYLLVLYQQVMGHGRLSPHSDPLTTAYFNASCIPSGTQSTSVPLSLQPVKETSLHPACDTRKPEYYQRVDVSRNRRSYSFQ